jgi:phosphosulfolactate synthase
MYNEDFANLSFDRRKPKPRESGLTVMIDRNLGINSQKEFITVSGDFVDIVKIMVGIPAIIPQNVLRQKIEIYKLNNIMAFPGGQFLELMFYKKQISDYFSDVVNAGFKLVEVSDNRVDISSQKKSDLIKTAIEKYGLKVLGETGSKKVASDIRLLIKDIKNCLNSGAWKVMFEAAELFEDGIFKEEVVEQLKKEINLNDIIFELPGAWISNIKISDIYSLMSWLVKNLGSKVNIANIDYQDILCLEAERLNLGPHMRF